MNIPKAEVPYPLEGYEFPETEENLVSWSQVMEKLVAAHDYWVCTVHPDGTPHARPVWGVVVEGSLYVGGSPEARWAKNLFAHGQVAIHLPDATDAVILEGTAVYIADDKELIAKTDAAYSEKYNIPHGPVWQIRPKRAFAWIGGMHTVTRWRFD